MKLSLEAVPQYNQIHSYDDNKVVIKQKQQSSLITLEINFVLMPEMIITDWQVQDIANLNEDDIKKLISMDPEVILFASGSAFTSQHFALVPKFSKHAIGTEFMTLGPACRTYNLLLAEERKVALAVCF